MILKATDTPFDFRSNTHITKGLLRCAIGLVTGNQPTPNPTFWARVFEGRARFQYKKHGRVRRRPTHAAVLFFIKNALELQKREPPKSDLTVNPG